MEICKYLAQNILSLRKKKNWSQDRLAQIAEIPRTTLTNMESGEGNPTLQNVIKVSEALGIGIEELIGKPRNEVVLLTKDEVPFKMTGQVLSYSLMPDRIKGIEVDKLILPPQTHLVGNPHIKGTKEYLTVYQGEVNLILSGQQYTVKKDEVLAFPGDQNHSYHNKGQEEAICFSVVLPLPSHY